jgi:hypothetical protein
MRMAVQTRHSGRRRTLVFFLAALAGCAAKHPADDPQAIEAQVELPLGEDASVGTYRLVVRDAQGAVQEITGERDGRLSDHWVADLTGDGVPEIVVWMTSAGSGSYGSLHVYQRIKGAFALRPLAAAPPDLLRGYLGHDTYEVASGELRRRFPLYDVGDPNARPSGATAALRYSFADERWTKD